MGVEEQKKLSTKVSASLILCHPVESVKSAFRLGSAESAPRPSPDFSSANGSSNTATLLA
jgi:hypothetical protein